ncbi:MAG: KH domain-containing protein [Chloroflexi bacterium]|nr:KH domain-containing protein [Chloroflexota bacterium]
MKELVEYIARAVVDHPDAVQVTQVEEDGRTILKVQVADEDRGKIIGRQGRVAEAIRTLLRVAAIKQGTRATLQID